MKKKDQNTFKTNFIGSSPDLLAIDAIFKSCENNGTDGLTLTEITGEACMEIISSTFGVTEDNVEMIFKTLDQDKNQILSKNEATAVSTKFLNHKDTNKPHPH